MTAAGFAPGLRALLAVIAAAACAPEAPGPVDVATMPAVAEPAPQEPFRLEAGVAYAIAELADPGVPLGLVALCDVTSARQYRLRHNRFGWPTCSARELYVGAADPAVLPEAMRRRLSDGRTIEIWPLVDVAAGAGSAIAEGRYALAARTEAPGQLAALTGALPVYAVRRGRIHYLGVFDGPGGPVSRDAVRFAAAFAESFPDAPTSRFDLSQTTTFEARCTPFASLSGETVLGVNCVGTARRSDPFATPRRD